MIFISLSTFWSKIPFFMKRLLSSSLAAYTIPCCFVASL